LPWLKREGAARGFGAASAHDYLEKIFQIPFWLRKMSAKATGDLMVGVIGKDNIETDEEPEKQETKGEEVAKLGRKGKKKPSQAPATPSGKGAPAPPAGAGAAGTQPRPVVSLKQVIERIGPKPQGLKIRQREVDFMQELAAIAGRSPRSVKRFINVYRLLKVSEAAAESENFLDGKQEFRAVLFLLAVLTGRIDVSERFVHALLRQPPSGALDDLEEALTGLHNDRPWELFTEELERFCVQHGNEIKVDSLQKWLRPALRFSFREWGRV
jgi:hypothetical protein